MSQLENTQVIGSDRPLLNDPAHLGTQVVMGGEHPLDAQRVRGIHGKLLQWYYQERNIQSENRLQMAIDADFYDGDQWEPQDAVELEGRGQVPLVFNEVAPMVDWLIGTERRSRVDWRVLPRSEDDVELADTKTKVLKYVSDVNRVPFNRSRAFSDAVKVGVGWMDDGVRDDPTKDILYSKYEDWRNVVWDSFAVELDMSDGRYLFRTRYMDADIAEAMYAERATEIRRAVQADRQWSDARQAEDEFYYQGHNSKFMQGGNSAGYISSGTGSVGASPRERVKLIEAQFRIPVTTKVVADGPFKGAFFDQRDVALMQGLATQGGMVVDKVMMRMHIAVFTETSMLSLQESHLRHNDFTLTPVWCYRRGRDRMPYGAIRRVRDIQMDMNKRASKALFLMSTNQLFAEKGAFDDMNEARDEVDRPDGVIIYNANKKIDVRRDSEQAVGQMQFMTLDAQQIQKSVGISSENLGRQTNASSGKAIEARQLQGGVVTTEPFDNLRLAVQVQGQKQLSLVEQWYSDEKVIRLTGNKNATEWVRINVPEMQPDGSVRFLNDITANQADFVVSEQDYAGTMRQVLFDSMNQLASRMPDPMLALRLTTIAMDFSDLPNHEAIADEIRKLTGERDPNKPMTPEEQAQIQQQMQAQADALRMQQEVAQAALAEQKAKVQEIQARAAKLMAEAEKIRAEGGVGAQDMANAAAFARRDADALLERTQQQLAKAQSDLANQTLKIRSDSDTALQVARINADSRERVAQIAAKGKTDAVALEQQLAAFERLAAGDSNQSKGE